MLSRKFSIGFFLPLFFWLVASCTPLIARAKIDLVETSYTHTLQFSGDRAWNHLETIMGFNPRYPGSSGINQTASYIENTITGYGAETIRHNFSVSGVPCANIIGKWRPNDTIPTDIIIIGGHYDARRRADQDPTLANKNLPVPAANDGGSSTVALLELAAFLNATYNESLLAIDEEIWLVFFDAEDQGDGGMAGFNWIEGSMRLAAAIDAFKESNQSITMFLLLDMIADDELRINQELNSDQTLLSEFFAMGRCLGHGQYFPTNPRALRITDDHVPFKNLGIPSVDIIDLDYPEWHTIADDLDHVSKESLHSVGKVAEGFILSKTSDVDNLELRDPDTGKTWTVETCSSNDLWMLFAGFLSEWWPLLVLGGMALIAAIYLLSKKKKKKDARP